ncbi:ABC transporter permease [Agrobacterium vitis]|uniref:ABC transporter permease n=1 Tax=Agrobacterium vitis TaxID=373 RepID=UPI0012E922C9|nr:ABC transporter permease [Agrobacterium vitis]MVA73127.1 ABC transporter permease subunit [Agrobacterium vitis]BCH62963.1 ABC transporter permease [Agrobacterium vitis]
MQRLGPIALIFHAIFVLFILAPLFMVIAVAFTDKGYLSLPTDGLSLRWFRAIFDNPDFTSAFWLSIWLALISASVAVLLAVPAALAIARHHFLGRDTIAAFLMSPLMIPHLVLGVALLQFYAKIGLGGTFSGLVAAHVVLVTPYALRLTLASLTGLPSDAEHAASTLGASKFTIFRRITLPLILPGVAGGWLLAFITSFDELTMSIFVAAPATQTLPVKMYNHITNTIDPLVASVSTVLIVLTFVFMLILDRFYGLDKIFVGKN